MGSLRDTLTQTQIKIDPTTVSTPVATTVEGTKKALGFDTTKVNKLKDSVKNSMTTAENLMGKATSAIESKVNAKLEKFKTTDLVSRINDKLAAKAGVSDEEKARVWQKYYDKYYKKYYEEEVRKMKAFEFNNSTRSYNMDTANIHARASVKADEELARYITAKNKKDALSSRLSTGLGALTERAHNALIDAAQAGVSAGINKVKDMALKKYKEMLQVNDAKLKLAFQTLKPMGGEVSYKKYYALDKVMRHDHIETYKYSLDAWEIPLTVGSASNLTMNPWKTGGLLCSLETLNRVRGVKGETWYQAQRYLWLKKMIMNCKGSTFKPSTIYNYMRSSITKVPKKTKYDKKNVVDNPGEGEMTIREAKVKAKNRIMYTQNGTTYNMQFSSNKNCTSEYVNFLKRQGKTIYELKITGKTLTKPDGEPFTTKSFMYNGTVNNITDDLRALNIPDNIVYEKTDKGIVPVHKKISDVGNEDIYGVNETILITPQQFMYEESGKTTVNQMQNDAYVSVQLPLYTVYELVPLKTSAGVAQIVSKLAASASTGKSNFFIEVVPGTYIALKTDKESMSDYMYANADSVFCHDSKEVMVDYSMVPAAYGTNGCEEKGRRYTLSKADIDVLLPERKSPTDLVWYTYPKSIEVYNILKDFLSKESWGDNRMIHPIVYKRIYQNVVVFGPVSSAVYGVAQDAITENGIDKIIKGLFSRDALIYELIKYLEDSDVY